MKTQARHRFESRLPADDTHPYRTGAWRPQMTEHDAWDLDVVGEIPSDLNGVYLRNTENPIFDALVTYHPFDGDAMLHSISFEAGEARYSNRFVRTEGLAAELEAGEPLFAGLLESPKLTKHSHGWGARTMMKDTSSTDVVVHRGLALTSHYQCGDLYRLDPVTLEDLGREDWSGRFPVHGVSAHQKVDEHTGELLFFNYMAEAPYMHCGVVSADGELVNFIDVPLPGPRLSHDMAFTENYAILNDCPLFWDEDMAARGVYTPRFHKEMTTRFAIVPRLGSSEDIVWFDADPTFVLHWINAYEDGDEIVLDGFFQHPRGGRPPRGSGVLASAFLNLDMHYLQARAHRWRFNMVTGECREESLSDRIMEFGMINGRHGGRHYRYSFNALPTVGQFTFDGVVKHDLETGAEAVYSFDEGTYCSETVVAPKDNSKAEDDAYLVTFTLDIVNDRSECVIFEATDPTAGPIARVALPERICSGTHATWAPASALG